MKVLVSDPITDMGISILEDCGLNIVYLPDCDKNEIYIGNFKLKVEEVNDEI